MLNKSLRILNFDDSLIKQSNLFCGYQTDIIDLKDIAGQSRLWMSQKIREDVDRRIGGSGRNSITFLGSGDFHHISQLLINRFDQPISVIVFDFHPDWDILPPRLGCGSWVTQSLKNKNILKFVLIGVSSNDISTGPIQCGNLAALNNDRVEIYSYAHKPSLVFFRRVPKNISFRREKKLFYKKIHWNELKEKNFSNFFSSFLKRLPTKQVYVSIDKDCLRGQYALTNWEEGFMSLDELLSALTLIKDNRDIVGLDIVGDYSPVSVRGTFKAVLSRLDHPNNFTAAKHPSSYVTALNEKTNLAIIELLLS